MWKPIVYAKEFSCLSTDVKDTTDIVEGSYLYEVDTSKPVGEQVTAYKFLQGDWRKL